jgi:uncharacterized protein YkvS
MLKITNTAKMLWKKTQTASEIKEIVPFREMYTSINMSNDKIVVTIDGNFVRILMVEKSVNNHRYQKLITKSSFESSLGYDSHAGIPVLMNGSISDKGLGKQRLERIVPTRNFNPIGKP